MARRDLMDFYGHQVSMLATCAVQCLREQPDLVKQWYETHGLASEGFARHMMAHFPGAPGPTEYEMARFAFHWACSGMPRIVLSHKLAASLAATRIPEGICDDVRTPWNWFVVVVPQKLLFNPYESTILCWPVDLENGEQGLRMRYQHWASPECAQRTGKPISDQLACGPWRDFSSPDGLLELREFDSEAKRSLALHMHLVFGAMLEFQEVNPSPPKHGARPAIPRSGPPKSWNFILSRNVQLDVRQHCRDYLVGSGKKLSKQFLVAGHWKNQACGVGRADRKRIHVEPYWRGPNDAPIAVRSHVLGSSNSSRAKEEVA